MFKRKNSVKLILCICFITATVIYLKLNAEIQINVISRQQKLIYKELVNNGDNKIYFNSKRELKSKNEFYLIVENTLVFDRTKFCQMKIDETELKKFKDYDKIILQSNTNQQRYDLLDNCDYKNCFFSCNKSLADQADALLFHDIKSSQLEFSRKESQVLIFWRDESIVGNPYVDALNLNWTLSFKQDSEVSHCAYGCYRRKKQNNLTLNYNDDWIKSEFTKRKSSSLWFVSNCNSDFRNKFAAGLSLKYSLNVYGNCKDKLQSKYQNKIEFFTNSCSRDSECELNELKTTKFFLAFENSNCTSYITEKFWRSLHFGIIPIVIQPNKESYLAVAPKDSFIHASDFNYDIDLIADYLNRVSNDFNLYSKYLNWKNKYETFFQPQIVEQYRICQLCTKLNTFTTKMYYRNITSYYNSACQ